MQVGCLVDSLMAKRITRQLEQRSDTVPPVLLRYCFSKMSKRVTPFFHSLSSLAQFLHSPPKVSGEGLNLFRLKKKNQGPGMVVFISAE